MKMIEYVDEESVFTPQKYLKKSKLRLPGTAIVTWHEGILKQAVEYGAKPVWDFVGGIRQTVYVLDYDGCKTAIAHIAQGGPNAAPFIEETHVLGVNNYIFVGSCGVLDDKVGTKIIVPEKALRDEGTSYHYTKTENLLIDIKTSGAVCAVLDSLKVPYVKGNTWTTDAAYRETKTAIEKAKSEGCICVEMECASVMAVCEFLNVKACQFMYTADRLNESEWSQGNLFSTDKKAFKTYFEIALAISKNV